MRLSEVLLGVVGTLVHGFPVAVLNVAADVRRYNEDET